MTMLTNSPRLVPDAPTIRRGVTLLLARLRRRIDRWAVAWIARRARQAALAELSRFNDRELKDIGLYRGQLNDALFYSAEADAAAGIVVAAPSEHISTPCGQ